MSSDTNVRCDPVSAATWSVRAETARDMVAAEFGDPGTGVPRARIGAPRRPTLDYWWYAHYVDALVLCAERRHRFALADATSCEVGVPVQASTSTGRRLRSVLPGPMRVAWTGVGRCRTLGTNEDTSAAAALDQAEALVRRIVRANRFRITNRYYDDMAWMAFALSRFGEVAAAAGRANDATFDAQALLQTLLRRLESASTGHYGGGVFWHHVRDFKNAPATGPTAIVFAREGREQRAAALADWLHDELTDPHSGLIVDGIRNCDGVRTVLPHIYTYNQGVTLGAYLAVGGQANLDRAQALISAVAEHLTIDGSPNVLRTHGDGDGGLFTGILLRHLLAAVLDQRLATAAREQAQGLIFATAEAFWQERRAFDRAGQLFFPLDVGSDARVPYLDLANQLQGWLALESAAAASGVHL